MKNTPKSNRSRRRFLSLGLLSGAALLTTDANAQSVSPERGETIQMLTPDGKLVEVSRNAVEQSAARKKVGNKDILDWSQGHKSSK